MNRTDFQGIPVVLEDRIEVGLAPVSLAQNIISPTIEEGLAAPNTSICALGTMGRWRVLLVSKLVYIVIVCVLEMNGIFQRKNFLLH